MAGIEYEDSSKNVEKKDNKDDKEDEQEDEEELVTLVLLDESVFQVDNKSFPNHQPQDEKKSSVAIYGGELNASDLLVSHVRAVPKATNQRGFAGSERRVTARGRRMFGSGTTYRRKIVQPASFGSVLREFNVGEHVAVHLSANGDHTDDDTASASSPDKFNVKKASDKGGTLPNAMLVGIVLAIDDMHVLVECYDVHLGARSVQWYSKQRLRRSSAHVKQSVVAPGNVLLAQSRAERQLGDASLTDVLHALLTHWPQVSIIIVLFCLYVF